MPKPISVNKNMNFPFSFVSSHLLVGDRDILRKKKRISK